MLITLHITICEYRSIWWNPTKLYKKKAPKERERKRNNGQRPKSKQVSSPNEVGHKEEREPLKIETFMSGMKHIN